MAAPACPECGSVNADPYDLRCKACGEVRRAAAAAEGGESYSPPSPSKADAKPYAPWVKPTKGWRPDIILLVAVVVGGAAVYAISSLGDSSGSDNEGASPTYTVRYSGRIFSFDNDAGTVVSVAVSVSGKALCVGELEAGEHLDCRLGASGNSYGSYKTVAYRIDFNLPGSDDDMSDSVLADYGCAHWTINRLTYERNEDVPCPRISP